MSIYYIDFENGKKENDGLSEKAPKNDYRDIPVKPGDSILFKRGTVVRDGIERVCGEKGEPVTYGAYGEGENPVFLGSLNMSDKENWVEVKNKIWAYKKAVSAEVCNFIFNDGEICGTLKWEFSELKNQGDWYDDCFECIDKADKKEHIYLKSEKNPGEYYKHIEAVTCIKKVAVQTGDNLIFENLTFKNWMFGIAGESGAKNLTVSNCCFYFIGGGVWNKNLKIQYGNAVEFWDVCENVTITDCYFEDIYDSAVTHQGGDACKAPVNMHFDNNVFIKCGMGAYEGRDRVPVNSSFNNNICIDAGEGFSKNGVIMPRNSEIYPQPMGHHVFLWRMDEKTEGGSMEIKNNLFYNAPYGACIYSIISEEAEKQFEIENNTYYTDNKELLNRLNGFNYKSFEEYKNIEKTAVYKKFSIEEIDYEIRKRKSIL